MKSGVISSAHCFRNIEKKLTRSWLRWLPLCLLTWSQISEGNYDWLASCEAIVRSTGTELGAKKQPLAEPKRTLSTFEEDVLSYYSEIDAADVQKALARFSEKAIYVRGAMVLTGVEEISTFYFKYRNLVGRHIITRLKAEEQQGQVYINGLFEGKAGDQPVSLAFTDLWKFDPQTNRVIFRESKIRDQ